MRCLRLSNKVLRWCTDCCRTVVVPSMPGHGFSFTPGQARFGLQDIADVLATLMTQVLGYRRFAAHGHDWGAFVSTRLGLAHAASLIGIHITLLAIPREASPGGPRSANEERYQQQLAHWLKEETGYSAIMGTKPQTLAYALSDSPVGLAAWIVEKFRNWSDGDVDGHFGRDVLLTNIMLYWLTGTINASFWPYYARMHGPWIVPPGEKVMVPTGYAEHPREILTPPRSLAEGTYGNIQRWTRMPRRALRQSRSSGSVGRGAPCVLPAIAGGGRRLISISSAVGGAG
jgi:pimeloyl-ACP methyl ester carboxylesterase